MTMFPHLITILNKVEDDDGVIYYPFIINNALFVSAESTTRGVIGLENRDKFKCTIPWKNNSQMYKDPAQYEAMSEKYGVWTLRKDDIIVKGQVNFPISKKNLQLQFPAECIMIISTIEDLRFGGLQHFQIGGN